jgi:hypothetical protein
VAKGAFGERVNEKINQKSGSVPPNLENINPHKNGPFWRPDVEWPKKRSVLAVPPLQLIQKFLS